MPATADPLARWVADARARTLRLAGSIRPDELLGPRLAVVNPPLWELGHVAWFQECWLLRHRAGQPPLLERGDALYDSAAIAHDDRWSLPLPSLSETVAYLRAVEAAVLERLRAGDPADRYFALLGIFHEDMHCEAMAFTRQTLGCGAPPITAAGAPRSEGGDLRGDARVPGGTWALGSSRDAPFVFDNEKWAHPVEIAPFAIARAPVTQASFQAFVDDGGYRRREVWSDPGWRWRAAAGAEQPVYWRCDGRSWSRRDFDRWVPLEPHRPMVHVCFFEAEAFCRWAGRRLPTEAEWEVAAAGEPDTQGRLSVRKRRYPWGDEPPTPSRAHVDFGSLGCLDVAALPAGESAFGCRQMIGNVWEWTASDLLPYPGFVPDPYEQYSAPWFGTHKVLRGGSFGTTSRLVHNAFRNFYTPDRRDMWAGFRTCAP